VAAQGGRVFHCWQHSVADGDGVRAVWEGVVVLL